MKDAIRRAADELRESITAISRDLHAHPELSLEEQRASALLMEKLEAAGFSVVSGQAGLPTAFVATLSGGPASASGAMPRRGAAASGRGTTRGRGAPPPRVALLAEYDALPGIGHGCGHNLIAAAGVGAGLVLARAARGAGMPSGAAPDLPGDLLVIGTPAEETIGGKVVMTRAGIFDGIDAAMMIHGGTDWRVFTDSLACVSIEVTYLGRESHAVAWPEKGINALDALIQLFVGLDMLKKRLGRHVKIPGVILEGGVRANIIPARAVGAFSLRAPTTSRLAEVRAEVERAARAIAEATGCRIEIRQMDEGYDDMVTNGPLAERFRDHLRDLGVRTIDAPRENKGSLDMGNVSRAVPSIHPFMAVAGPDTPIHTAAFAAASVTPPAEENLLIAVKALALTAFDVLSDPDLLSRAREEFDREVRKAQA